LNCTRFFFKKTKVDLDINHAFSVSNYTIIPSKVLERLFRYPAIMPKTTLTPPCICIGDDYSNQCPYTFEQGGGKYHCAGGNMIAIPIGDGNDSTDTWERESNDTGMDDMLNKLYNQNLNSRYLPPPPPPPPLNKEQIYHDEIENYNPETVQPTHHNGKKFGHSIKKRYS